MRTLKFLNDPSTCVSDAVDGICLSNPYISRIKGLNVLVRSDIASIKDKQVSLICGGGSGHEPAHAGYIGQGMLAGAVLGNVFASPPVHAILAAIRVCAGRKGVLLIVKNYTGDRLNFGMATERARAEGLLVQMVVVDDDCALPPGKGITGARGVAGTVFVHKVAGAEAARPGSTLESVKAVAEATISNMVSYGVAMGLCAVPGTHPTDRLADKDVIEVGLGIHAEAGQVQPVDPSSLDLSSSTVRHMLDKMLGSNGVEGVCVPARLETRGSEPVAVLLNNLGGISELELLVLLRDLLDQLHQRGVNVVRCYSGSFMTSLEMAGVSVSLLKVEVAGLACNALSLLAALDSPTAVAIWRASPVLGQGIKKSVDIEYNMGAKALIPTGGGPCESFCVPVLVLICNALKESSSVLNEYDAVCGDGDCGRVVLSAAERVLQLVQEGVFSASPDRASFCYHLAEAVSEAMGGTSGAITEIMLRAIVTYFTSTSPESATWSTALSRGVAAVRTCGGAEVGMRTMLDALVPAVEALGACKEASQEDARIAQAVAAAARCGMEQTKHMESLAGRANYVSLEAMRGTPDPGAFAVFLAFEAAASHFT